MSFTEFWQQLLTKRPKLAEPDATIEITADNLKRLLHQTYDQGEMNAKQHPDFPPFPDYFKS